MARIRALHLDEQERLDTVELVLTADEVHYLATLLGNRTGVENTDAMERGDALNHAIYSAASGALEMTGERD